MVWLAFAFSSAIVVCLASLYLLYARGIGL